MKRIEAVGIAVAIFCSSGFVNAASINAGVSRYTFELVDLDDNDGITPSITFSNHWRGAAISTAEYFGAETTYNSHYSADATGLGLSGGWGAYTGYYIDQEVPVVPGGSHFWASVITDRTGYTHTVSSWDADYSLSANTKLVFRAFADAWIDMTPVVDTEFGTAQVAVRLSQPGEGDALPFYSRSVSSLNVETGTAFGEWFTLELVNDSPSSLDAHLSVSTMAEGGVTAVPEPSTYLMLGSGLLLTAAALRRRRAPKAN